jgi:hypothetical protein
LIGLPSQIMFVSQQRYEFPFPAGLEEPGAKHWRMMELTLHAPWFLLSAEVVDPEGRQPSHTRTVCIAWEHDLADVLRSLDVGRVTGVVCMMPAWRSANGQWSSREVREVWLHSSPGGEHVELIDTAGEKFDCGLIPDHVGAVEAKLLLRVNPTHSTKQ